MMNKPHRQKKHHTPQNRKAIEVRFDPTVNEGPGTLRNMEQKIRGLKDTVKKQEGEISTLRRLLSYEDVNGHWGVPG